jgi:hypothetical protein
LAKNAGEIQEKRKWQPFAKLPRAYSLLLRRGKSTQASQQPTDILGIDIAIHKIILKKLKADIGQFVIASLGDQGIELIEKYVRFAGNCGGKSISHREKSGQDTRLNRAHRRTLADSSGSSSDDASGALSGIGNRIDGIHDIHGFSRFLRVYLSSHNKNENEL